MPTAQILFVAFFLSLNVVIWWVRYSRQQKVKRKSWDTIDALYDGKISPSEYASSLTYLVSSIEVNETQCPVFSNLVQLKDTTVNEYYVVKEVFAVQNDQYLVIADTLTYKSYTAPLAGRGEPIYSNMLYTTHILISQVSPTLICCYSVVPDDDIHANHLRDFCGYLLCFVNNLDYQFAIPPRYSL